MFKVGDIVIYKNPRFLEFNNRCKVTYVGGSYLSVYIKDINNVFTDNILYFIKVNKRIVWNKPCLR